MFAETVSGRWQSQRRAPEMWDSWGWAGEAGGEEERLMEKVHSAYRKDSYTGSKDSCTLPLSARPGEKTQPCYSQKWKGKGEGATVTGSIEGISYQVEEKHFSQLKLVSPRQAVRRAHWSPPVEIFQPCLDKPWEPRPLPEASPARLTSQGHFQPWVFQDSRQVLTSGDTHKGRKKLTWQLRNQPLFIFSQTWIAFKGPGKLFHAKINTQPKIPI